MNPRVAVTPNVGRALGLVMRRLVPAVVLLLTAACGAYSFPGSSPSHSAETGAISGRVLSVPCSPVMIAGDACAGRPVAGLEIDYSDGSGSVSRTVTDTAGGYAIRLEAGAYAVKMKTYMRLISGPLKVDIEPGSNTVANYVLDSGIRVPQPAPAPKQ